MYFDETIRAVGEAYVAHCRNPDNRGKVAPLYASFATSREPIELQDMPEGVGPYCEGLDAIELKHKWFFSQFDVVEMDVDGPYLHEGSQFGVQFSYQIRHRESGETFPSKELGIFTVQEGKIVQELFYQQV